MTTTFTKARLAMRIATLLLVLSAAAGCSSSVIEIASDRQAAEVPPASLGTPEYGASLDEWSQMAHAPAPALPDSSASEAQTEASDSGATIVDWSALIPAGASGEDIFARYQDLLDSVEPGSDEARVLYEEMQAEFDPEAVNPDLDGTSIRLAGFVAPLTYEGDLITEFLLVPNFGACIHVPPPPPNQTVLVTVEDGLTVDEAWGAVWVEGVLEVSAAETELAAASYAISGGTSGAYTDF